ncbi:NAD and Zn-dependent alcohol dehydrogenase [Mycotypha africana]|uniref:NAD and Zn-dependent alcohol dehydrogenase n=1 Tax=Mycotypha africana TaxID=64632 RepID=UPI002300D4DC|nr:NAD and Zn-dependent alcohol dehydrogenase [Mycotypha africana]KAI8967965.1 NAD and Zn-dependent alcohol dehydrogenase [Mycotypha africana]
MNRLSKSTGAIAAYCKHTQQTVFANKAFSYTIYRRASAFSAPQTLNGWACYGKGQPLVKAEFPLTQFDDDSVDMDIICCGICGTDIHTIDSGWGPTHYPTVVGHEIIGRVKRVGKNVKHLKVGDRAGVGCQCDACHQCGNCQNHKENLCEDHATWTFNDRWKNGDVTYGGFADRWRGRKEFVFKIPDALSSIDASSILCGGVTTYAPLKRYGVGKGSKLAVLGLGGLGHFGVQWAKKMGAEVVAYDINEDKKQDAKDLGCDDYVLINQPDQVQRHMNTFTHILATKVLNKQWSQYFEMLKKSGTFILCDIPEEPLSGLSALTMASKQINVAGSFIGSPDDIREALAFAAKHGVRTWAKEFRMDQVNEAIKFVREGQPRYRAVLVN